MKTSGRIVSEIDDTRGHEKAARIICCEKARTVQSIFPKKSPVDSPPRQPPEKQNKPLIFYLMLLTFPIVAFAVSLQIADLKTRSFRHFSPSKSVDASQETVPDRTPPLPTDKEEAALLRYDDYEEFWNIISEPDVPLSEKKEWVDRLFKSDGNNAYDYFTLNIYDFSHDPPLQAAINEVCTAHGFPAIVIYDKTGIREELSGFFSRKWLLWILAGSPVPLILLLAAMRFFLGST